MAQDLAITHLSFNDYMKDSSNYAYGQFYNPGVTAHPSDKGMYHIATALYQLLDKKIRTK